MVWRPLAGGFLSGQCGRDGAKEGAGRRDTFDFPPVDEERGYNVIDAMKPIAEAKIFSRARLTPASPGRDRPGPEGRRCLDNIDRCQPVGGANE
jgi:hypothetical protein